MVKLYSVLNLLNNSKKTKHFLAYQPGTRAPDKYRSKPRVVIIETKTINSNIAFKIILIGLEGEVNNIEFHNRIREERRITHTVFSFVVSPK